MFSPLKLVNIKIHIIKFIDLKAKIMPLFKNIKIYNAYQFLVTEKRL